MWYFFTSLYDTTVWSKIMFQQITRLDLNMYIGRNDRKSKTKVISFPSRKTLIFWLLKYENMTITSVSDDNALVDINENKKLLNEIMKEIINRCYDNVIKTHNMIVEKNGFISFANYFSISDSLYLMIYLINMILMKEYENLIRV